MMVLTFRDVSNFASVNRAKFMLGAFRIFNLSLKRTFKFLLNVISLHTNI